MFVNLDTRRLDATIRELTRYPGLFQRAKKSAMGSVGWMLQQDLKEYGQKGSRYKWPRRSPYTKPLASGKRRAVATKTYTRGPRKGQVRMRKSRSLNPMGRLVNTPRYIVSKTGNSVMIGFGTSKKQIGGSPEDLVRLQAKGRTIKVTPKMRRMFFAMGLPLSKTTRVLRVPARPWVRPVWVRNRRHIPKRFEQKFIGALKRYGVEIQETVG